ncbi:LysM peptidoglycan-binding domain-containing protein [Chthonobacter rhizosphaerae]|uniref:LysM peptidoglycan-binding domain-containing protein n=1 Tax=Chthonobacter rhizosphaerae TaxID=2735553 RepID=UPI0015EEB5FC|nr:LysM peptidoglycan-binding domain-containing protein [Chthonobacter rhizosphaerae]
MTRQQGIALVAAIFAAIALSLAYGSGALDEALRMAGLAPEAAAPDAPGGATAVVSEPPKAAAPTGSRQVVPVFDLVRVEPTGDAVIAGQAQPGAAIEILSGATVIAKGTANTAGEWAIVLSDPLKAGAHDLVVRTTSPNGGTLVSEQSVAVSVPEGGKGEVLVVLNQPGVASTVLQVPGLDEAREALTEAGVGTDAFDKAEAARAAGAAQPPASAPAPATDPAAPPAAVAEAAPAAPAGPEGETRVAAAPAMPQAPPDGGAASPSAGAGTAVEATVPTTAPAPSPAGDATAGAAPGQTAGASQPPPAEAPVAPGAAPSAADAPAADAPAADAPAAPGADTAASPPGAADTAAAPSASEPPAGQAPAAAAPPRVTIEAVETEGGTLYAAGSAEAGVTIRLYVNETIVADARADSNARWLVEAPRTLEPGSHTVRVDQVGPDGSVVARSEVVFEQVEDPMQVAGAGSSQVVAGSGSAGEARVGSAKTIIIRRGDNLWRIARRLYGMGVRYSTIYEANSDQIRNPGLIYPGQVFVLPEGDAAWSQAAP